MKKKIYSTIMAICVMLLTAVFVGCDKNMYTLKTENDVTSLKPGESTQLIIDAEDKTGITFVIEDGEEYATLTKDGLLTIKNDAKPNEEVEVVAKKDGKVVSNELEISISPRNLTSLEAECDTNVVTPNSWVKLEYEAVPSDTTESITWSIVDGGNYATTSDNKLLISQDAPVGTVIKVKAVGATMSSNILTFTVVATLNTNLQLSVEGPKTIDAGKTTNDNIVVEVFDSLFAPVDGQSIKYEIVEGGDFIELEADGYSCGLKVIGHGTAKVKVSITGTQEFEEIDINCIKAPDSVSVPLALQDKLNVEFNTGIDQNIEDFVFDIAGDNVCQDLVYSFEKWDGTKYVANTTGGTLNSSNVLKFTELGKFRVTATSNSGSVVNKSTQVVFNVNDGVNVSTFEAFRTQMLNLDDLRPINIVNMTENGEYGYNLVPSVVLNGTENANSYSNDITINIRGKKRVALNGNGYSVDLSGMKYFEGMTTDYDTFIRIRETETEEANYMYNNGDSEGVINNKKRPGENLTQADYTVVIKDFNLIGNSDIDGTVGDHAFDPAESLDQAAMAGGEIILASTFRRAIEIGGDRVFIGYHVSIDNIDISGFPVGLRISHAVGNSKVSNVAVNNIFATGVESCANIITFENMYYGPCGAAGIEMTADSCTMAGLDFSQNQTITFAGTIETDNIIIGDADEGTTTSMYLNLFAQGVGMDIPTILQGSMMAQPGHSQDKQDNILRNGSFIFIALIFNEMASNMQLKNENTTVLNYASELNDAGIEDYKDLVKEDLTHKYVVLPLAQNFGRILLFNWNFIEAEEA